MKKPSKGLRKILGKKAIKDQYQTLLKIATLTPQQRGYEFEFILYSLLHNAKVDPRSSYQPVGEQIDGSFFWQGQTFLLEAKWVKDPLPVSSIYAFKGKLDGKFHTTSGIFIAVNGFSPEVEDALKFGKTLNILLFDEKDVPLLLNGEVDFLDMLQFKLREAGDTGTVKASYELERKAKELSEDTKEVLGTEEIVEKVGMHKVPKRKKVVDDLLVFVEGKSDVAFIRKLLAPLKRKYFLSYQILPIYGADNVRELPTLINLYGSHDNTKAVILILDEDAATDQSRNLIDNITEQIKKSSISVRTWTMYINAAIEESRSVEDNPVFEELESFIQKIAEDYYDPVTDTPAEVLKSRLENLKWNYKEKEIEGDDDYTGHSFTISKLEELIDYLNEEMVSAMHGEMPLEWLHEQDSLDYEDEICEYLLQNYSEQIDKMGWDSNNL